MEKIQLNACIYAEGLLKNEIDLFRIDFFKNIDRTFNSIYKSSVFGTREIIREIKV